MGRCLIHHHAAERGHHEWNQTMMTQDTLTVRLADHVAAIDRAWHRHGRQIAAETLMTYEGCTLADSRAAAAAIREQWAKHAADSLIETAQWMTNVHGVCPSGTL